MQKRHTGASRYPEIRSAALAALDAGLRRHDVVVSDTPC